MKWNNFETIDKTQMSSPGVRSGTRKVNVIGCVLERGIGPLHYISSAMELSLCRFSFYSDPALMIVNYLISVQISYWNMCEHCCELLS